MKKNLPALISCTLLAESQAISSKLAPPVNRRLRLQSLGIVPVVILLFLFFGLLEPRFYLANNVVNIFRLAAVNIIIAAGMTLVILTGGIDLSVGSTVAVAAVVSVSLTLGPLSGLAIPLALLLGLLIGLVNGAIITFIGGIPPFIVTMGTMTTLRGFAYLLAKGTTVINEDLPFSWLGTGSLFRFLPIVFLVALLTVAVCYFVLRKTPLGVHIYAFGGNPVAAELNGIKKWQILLFAYGMSGLFAALAGVMMAARLNSGNGAIGVAYELDAIAAVVIGGTSFVGGLGGIGGTFFGALVIAVLNAGLTTLNVPYFWQLVVKGAVIVFAVALDVLRRKYAK